MGEKPKECLKMKGENAFAENFEETAKLVTEQHSYRLFFEKLLMYLEGRINEIVPEIKRLISFVNRNFRFSLNNIIQSKECFMITDQYLHIRLTKGGEICFWKLALPQSEDYQCISFYRA